MATLSRVCGICSGVHTLACGVLAPTARASGVQIDVRRDLPYAAYGELGFQIVPTCRSFKPPWTRAD